MVVGFEEEKGENGHNGGDTEFDSDSSVFFHKVSCKFFDSLAKLKLSFQNNKNGEISEPQIGLTTKATTYLSLHYALEEHNALIKGSFDISVGLQLRAAHDVKGTLNFWFTSLSVEDGVNDSVFLLV